MSEQVKLLSAEDAQRLIAVSGWFAVSPPNVRSAIQAIASGAAVVIPAGDFVDAAKVREVSDMLFELASSDMNSQTHWDIRSAVEKLDAALGGKENSGE